MVYLSLSVYSITVVVETLTQRALTPTLLGGPIWPKVNKENDFAGKKDALSCFTLQTRLQTTTPNGNVQFGMLTWLQNL